MAQWFINHVAETAILSSSSKLRFGFFDSGKKEKQREKVTGKNREIEPIPPLHFHYFSGIKIGWIPLSTSTGSDAVQARREIKNPPKKKGSSAGMKPNCVDCYTKYFPLQLLHSQQLRFSAPPPPLPSIHPSRSLRLFGREEGGYFFVDLFRSLRSFKPTYWKSDGTVRKNEWYDQTATPPAHRIRHRLNKRPTIISYLEASTWLAIDENWDELPLTFIGR